MAQTSTGSFYSLLEKGVPRSLTRNTVMATIKATRKEVAVRPYNQATYTPQTFLTQINLPINGIYDFSRSKLIFTASFAQTGGTYVRCSNGIWTMLSRIRILSSSKTIEDFRNYNQWCALFYQMIREPDVDSNFGPTWGVGSQASRNIWASGYTYAIPLLCGFFTLPPLNTDAMQGGLTEQITMELYWDQPVVFMENDGTLPTYTVNQVLWYVDLLEIPEASVRKTISQRGSTYKITTVQAYPNPIFQQQNYQITITHKCNSLVALVGVQLTTGNQNTGTVNDKLETFNYNGCINYQTRINMQYYPQEPIDALGQVGSLGQRDVSFNRDFESDPIVTGRVYQLP